MDNYSFFGISDQMIRSCFPGFPSKWKSMSHAACGINEIGWARWRIDLCNCRSDVVEPRLPRFLRAFGRQFVTRVIDFSVSKHS